MRKRMRGRLVTAIIAAGLVGGLALGSPSALADPELPPPPPAPIDPAAAPAPPPDPFARRRRPPPPPPRGPAAAAGRSARAAAARGPRRVPAAATRSRRRPIRWRSPPMIPEGTPAGQNPTPYTGEPVFAPPTFNPMNGSMVGVAKPIYINFARPIADRPMAEQAIHISSIPPVPGRFYWISDTQVRWRPQDFWPANTIVNIDASGTKSSFRTVPEQLVATIDDKAHQMTGHAQREGGEDLPGVDGQARRQARDQERHVLRAGEVPRHRDGLLDLRRAGHFAEGYKLKVQNAVRIDNSGAFVHSAPWSVGDQGKRNVSHGCINLSPANAQWFYDNFGSGDPVVIKNSVGTYNQPDGASDWQMF